MKKKVRGSIGSARPLWRVVRVSGLLALWAVLLTCGSVAAQSGSQTAPAPNRNITVPGPQRSAPQPQRQSPPPGARAPQPILQAPGAGTVEGFVYWDANQTTHKPGSSCSGLAITVSVGSSSGGPLTAYTPIGTLSNNFKYVGQVKQFLTGGKVNVYDVCTYGFDHVPVGPNLQVKLTVTDPSAFSPYVVPQSAILGPINIINAQCNMLPQIVNPTFSDLVAHWGSCQNMAYDVNFPMQAPARVSGGAGGLTPVDSGSRTGMLSGAPQPGLLAPGTTQSAQPQGSSNTLLGNHQTAPAQSAGMQSPASKVELNPQPLPPRVQMTNAEVIKMLRGGIPESVIISSLQSATRTFDFSSAGCRALQQAHVTPKILNAMGDGSARPCPEITGNRAVNGPESSDGSRQAITDITNRGASATSAGIASPQASPAAKGTSPSRTVLKPVKLAPPTALRRLTNPRLSQQNASIIAVLEQQRQAVQQESAAMKAAVPGVASAASVRSPALSANLRGSALSQGLAPAQTQSSPGNFASSIAHAPAFNSVVLICSTDPSPRILRVNGGQAPGIFTPEAKYNQYTISGCSLGQSDPGNSAYIFGPNGFKVNLNIDFWSDNGITAHLDPWLAGVLDQDNVTLVVAPAGKQPFNKAGYKFYAARGMPGPDGNDQEVALAYDSMPQSGVKLYDATPVVAAFDQVPPNGTSQFPSFSFQGTQVAGWVFRYAYGHNDDSYPISSPCYVNDVASNPDKTCGGYFQSTGLAPGTTGTTDTWNFNELVAGFSISSFELFYENTDASSLCGAWDDGGKNSGLAGNWDFNLDSQNQILVSWPVYWCTDWESMPFANRTNKQVQSSYGLEVWVLGPRCVDPWTGQKNQACMSKVKQILS